MDNQVQEIEPKWESLNSMTEHMNFMASISKVSSVDYIVTAVLTKSQGLYEALAIRLEEIARGGNFEFSLRGHAGQCVEHLKKRGNSVEVQDFYGTVKVGNQEKERITHSVLRFNKV